jgi:hypothetical protein
LDSLILKRAGAIQHSLSTVSLGFLFEHLLRIKRGTSVGEEPNLTTLMFHIGLDAISDRKGDGVFWKSKVMRLAKGETM